MKCITMFLPVRVLGPRGSKIIYALLDEVATITVINKEVAQKIGAGF